MCMSVYVCVAYACACVNARVNIYIKVGKGHWESWSIIFSLIALTLVFTGNRELV